jgi:anti-sigma B factor antagonist
MERDQPVLRVMEQTSGDAIVVTVQGELDIATADLLSERLAKICERGLPVTVDLRRVSFLDCVGLRVLLAVHADGAARGCHVDFIPGPRAVQRVFELTGTLETLPFTVPGAAATDVAASTA